jgi:hypothetical protein
MSDFEFYLGLVMDSLPGLGIEYREATGRIVPVRAGATRYDWRLEGDSSIGFLFVSPGRPVSVRFGVMTTDEIMAWLRQQRKGVPLN